MDGLGAKITGYRCKPSRPVHFILVFWKIHYHLITKTSFVPLIISLIVISERMYTHQNLWMLLLLLCIFLTSLTHVNPFHPIMNPQLFPHQLREINLPFRLLTPKRCHLQGDPYQKLASSGWERIHRSHVWSSFSSTYAGSFPRQKLPGCQGHSNWSHFFKWDT